MRLYMQIQMGDVTGIAGMFTVHLLDAASASHGTCEQASTCSPVAAADANIVGLLSMVHRSSATAVAA
jgi:hypothetical protein